MGGLDYHRDEHQVPLIVSPLIWCPKRRRKVLVHQIGKRCEDRMRQQWGEQGWTILDLAVQPNHVQLFVCVWPSVRAAAVVKAGAQDKGCCAFTLCTEFPERPRLPALWTRS